MTNEKILTESDNNKNEISAAIDIMSKKRDHSTEEKKPEIKVGNVKSYKEHEISVAINNFLSKNLDEESGSYLVGENAARTLEHYGLKGHPVLGLVLSVVMVIVHIFMKAVKDQDQENKDGI